MKTTTNNKAWEMFDKIRQTRRARVCDIKDPLEYEAWARQRREVQDFIGPLDMAIMRRSPHWYAWTGTRHRQIFAAYPERASEGRFLLSVQTRGPLFPPSLWDRYVEAERAMAPVSYAVIACGLAFLGFAAWWMR